MVGSVGGSDGSDDGGCVGNGGGHWFTGFLLVDAGQLPVNKILIYLYLPPGRLPYGVERNRDWPKENTFSIWCGRRKVFTTG